eukprot:6424739-Amphidinium_carterae.1
MAGTANYPFSRRCRDPSRSQTFRCWGFGVAANRRGRAAEIKGSVLTHLAACKLFPAGYMWPFE